MRKNTECDVLPPECAQLLVLFDCGVWCTPTAQKVMDGKNRLRVCQSFADRIWTSCKGVQYYKQNSGVCETFSDRFGSASKMVEQWAARGNDYTQTNGLKDSLFPGFVYAADDRDCFNSASTVVISAALSLSLVLVAVFA